MYGYDVVATDLALQLHEQCWTHTEKLKCPYRKTKRCHFKEAPRVVFHIQNIVDGARAYLYDYSLENWKLVLLFPQEVSMSQKWALYIFIFTFDLYDSVPARAGRLLEVYEILRYSLPSPLSLWCVGLLRSQRCSRLFSNHSRPPEATLMKVAMRKCRNRYCCCAHGVWLAELGGCAALWLHMVSRACGLRNCRVPGHRHWRVCMWHPSWKVVVRTYLFATWMATLRCWWFHVQGSKHIHA